jgi:hypothetical protein
METRASKRHRGDDDWSEGVGGTAGPGGAVVAGGSAAAISLGGEHGESGQFASLPRDGPPDHPSPGYGAGYDAGFQAGLIAASQGRAPPLLPVPGATAQGAPARARPNPRARRCSRWSRTSPTFSRRRCSSAWTPSISRCSAAREARFAPR